MLFGLRYILLMLIELFVREESSRQLSILTLSECSQLNRSSYSPRSYRYGMCQSPDSGKYPFWQLRR